MEEDRFPVIGVPLWDRQHAQAVDRLSCEQFKIHPLVLMETAGRGVADIVTDHTEVDRPVIVLCGRGNNGGDGMVAARYLTDAGYDVHVFLVTEDPEAKLSDSCQSQYDTLQATMHTIHRYRPGDLAEFEGTSPVIVDAVFGLGFKGPLSGNHDPVKALREASQINDKTVIAVDLPSGLDANRGEMQEIPLSADITVTFGGHKPAQILAPAKDWCGDVVCLDIGFPGAATNAAMESNPPVFVRADPVELMAYDPWSALPPSAHKFDRGHVLIIGGSEGKSGAPLLAAMAALRGGAGWASVALPPKAQEQMRGHVPREITFEPLFDEKGLLPDKLAAFIKERQVRAVVVGPGTTSNPLTRASVMVLRDFGQAGGAIVLDAAALHGVGPLLAEAQGDPHRLLLTPHPGEWPRLGPDVPNPPDSPDHLAECQEYLGGMGATVIYKSATPIVVTGEDDTYGFVTDEGSVALARAGSGDVLAGVAAAHGAIGFRAVTAALRAQVIVARAANLAGEEKGAHAVVATDIIERLGMIDE